ncbi:RNA-directed DNA polymerase [Polaribacter sp. R2A056_3_33]|uniref:reverse transcriptase domain-containing protein n=1 Tax=Polaribacter sp. R2A056_3_33 TaxID=2745563 RepID=UPI001C501FBB|nr:reverse transcriptase domain-containing protein [Polaribacter sp. R2A056_3_33]QXP72117.1 RNA-directed DNA polymerase [Polaribacter sp. R2A056_3_33]
MNTFNIYKKEFTKKALESGYSADELNKCLVYAEPLFNKRLPIIYNLSHFAAHVGYSTKFIRRAIKTNGTEFFYRKYSIPKKNGSSRVINEPLPSLKEIQKWVLDNILNNMPISAYAKAYTFNRSIKDHVKYHENQNVVLTMDIENFFNNITSDKVERLFIDKGYSPLVSNLLSRICTLNNSLPQGAPTSPRISNILMLPFDNEIAKYCKPKFIGGKKVQVKYTRYADDIAFSGEINKAEFVELVSNELQKLDLSLNEDKTIEKKRNQQQIISGIIVNQKIQVPRKKRDELKQAMYYIEKFGLENHLARIKCTKANYVSHLLGIANYIVFINPKDKKTLEIRTKLFEMKD